MRRSRISAPTLLRQLGVWRSTGGSGPAYRELADAIRLLVLDGRLPLDIGVPGERNLADAAALSRTTVSAAYAVLRDGGFLASTPGAASRISLPGRGTRDRPGPDGSADADVLDFATAVLPANANVHAAYAKALLRLPEHLPRHGYEPVGLERLRQVIADRYARTGLATAADQILVTNGAQHAFALSCASSRNRATGSSSTIRPTPMRSTRSSAPRAFRCRSLSHGRVGTSTRCAWQ